MRIISFLLVMFPLVSFAQQDAVKKTTEVYCMLISSEKFLSKSVKITVDYGNYKDRRVIDQSAEIVQFNSIVDALNYMSQQGWQFVSAYNMTLGGVNVYHYMLKRQLPAIQQEGH